MPWLRTEPMDERVQFIADWRKGEASKADLCRRYGISRRSGYNGIAKRKCFSDRQARHGL